MIYREDAKNAKKELEYWKKISNKVYCYAGLRELRVSAVKKGCLCD